MTQTPHIQLQGLALNAGEASPEWVQLTPAGPDITGRDGRSWRLSDPAAVAARFAARRQPIVVDIDHLSELAKPGEPAPAQGWIETVEVRDGALWGQVSWNKSGRALMEAEAYRFLSPTFLFDPKSREIMSLRSAALVHRPNLEMQALNSETEETVQMDKAICEALGLAADATAADAVVAITRLKDAKAVALNAADHPDPGKFVPKADHELALNRIREFEADETARNETAVGAAVDAAVAAGKIAPASKEYHLATCKAVGIEKFQQMVGTLPVIAGGTRTETPATPGKASALTADEIAVCAQLGHSHTDFAAAKATEETR
ncbi:MAG: hypothetical protein KDA73_10615 [Rhodobacteraceae bacterium]|nr:hypothetical protein [Paracoccaceae bacterium]